MLIGIDGNEANLTSNRVGVNQYAYYILKSLSQINCYHRFVIYLKTPPLSDLPPSGSNWTYRVIPFPKLWTQTRLPVDLYLHHPRPDIFLSLTHYSPRYSPIPLVVSIMDLGYLKFPEQFTSKDFLQLKNWTSYSIQNATKIVAISQQTKQDIIKTYGRKPEDILVAYPGFDESLFVHVIAKQILKKYGIKQPYFIFVGSLKPNKNIESLIKAFKKLNRSNYSLVIVGKKAWLYDRIFSLTKSLNMSRQVVFTGFVPESDLPALISNSQAFVLPSFYEGFGIPVLEAMACEVPVIVSRVASLPEVAGPAGIYIDPESVDSIAAGLEKSIGPLRSAFVKKGLARVKLFNWSDSAGSIVSLLESVGQKNHENH